MPGLYGRISRRYALNKFSNVFLSFLLLISFLAFSLPCLEPADSFFSISYIMSCVYSLIPGVLFGVGTFLSPQFSGGMFVMI